MRGEQSSNLNHLFTGQGSPPHARGADFPYDLHLNTPGITPACAGSRLSPRTGNPSRRDHPRMRGEQRPKCETDPQHPGSPPHTRGAVNRKAGQTDGFGITPAYAGSRFHKH